MKRIRVLLVDDETEFTEVLSERMEMRGIASVVCDNGEDALKIANEQSFDAVILDLAMPGMDGIETLKHMLRINPDLQVILLTGQGTLESSVEAFRSGAMDFLEKPPNIDDLIARLQKAKDTTDRLTELRIEEAMKNIMSRKGW